MKTTTTVQNSTRVLPARPRRRTHTSWKNRTRETMRATRMRRIARRTVTTCSAASPAASKPGSQADAHDTSTTIASSRFQTQVRFDAPQPGM